jgi:hypothetical protein
VKAIKVRNEEALTKIRAKLTAKVNEVKAIEKTLTGSKIEREKQLNKKKGSEPTITLPPRFTTMFNISISIYISIIFTIFIFKNFISISKSIVSDLWITIFKHLLLEISVSARRFVYHDRQPQFRQKP